MYAVVAMGSRMRRSACGINLRTFCCAAASGTGSLVITTAATIPACNGIRSSLHPSLVENDPVIANTGQVRCLPRRPPERLSRVAVIVLQEACGPVESGAMTISRHNFFAQDRCQCVGCARRTINPLPRARCAPYVRCRNGRTGAAPSSPQWCMRSELIACRNANML